jgi:RNA polymerase sigma factor for flagellar operon FliA
MNPVDAAYTKLEQSDDYEQLILEQLPQVRYIARRIHERLPQHVQLEDLVHAGIVGLIDAVHKYDEAKNVQFKSYAKFRIRGAILDSLRELDWSPRDLRRKARAIEQASARLGTRLGRAATEAEIAAELEMDLADLQQVLGELGGLDLGSLQIQSQTEDGDEDLCEYLPGDPESSPYYLCFQSELKKMLARSISRLSEKEQQVLSLYYYEELTMKEVGAALGVGESRVSQIHSLALLRLRTYLQEMLSSKLMPPQVGHVVDTLLEAAWKRS